MAKDVSGILQKTILVFPSCDKEKKVFYWSLKANDYAFAHTNLSFRK